MAARVNFDALASKAPSPLPFAIANRCLRIVLLLPRDALGYPRFHLEQRRSLLARAHRGRECLVSAFGLAVKSRVAESTRQGENFHDVNHLALATDCGPNRIQQFVAFFSFRPRRYHIIG